MTRSQKLKKVIYSFGNDARTNYLGGYGSGLFLGAFLSAITDAPWFMVAIGLIFIVVAMRRYYKELS